jgi:hypothetical protein
MLEMTRSYYRAALPESLRAKLWKLRHSGYQAVRVNLWKLRQPAPKPMPTVAGLLDRGFGVTPARHEALARNTPTVALYMAQNCSHGCVYCVSHMYNTTKRSGFLEEVGWEEYGRLLLKLAGNIKVVFNFAGPGECAEQTDFVPLVRLLLNAGHFVVIQTHGLSSKTIAHALEPYSREFIAERVTLHLSFHIAAYLDDADTRRLDAYVQKHITRLAKLGCLICLIVPMSPKVLVWERIEEHLLSFKKIAEDSKSRGFIYALTEFHGPYQGRHFPADYTPLEQQRMSYLMTKFGNPSRGELDGASAVAVGDGLFTRGLPCYAHVMNTEVLSDGSLSHCQSIPPNKAGHLRDEPSLDQKFEAKPCPYQKCECVSVGMNLSLKPCGITLQDYAEELQRVENHKARAIRRTSSMIEAAAIHAKNLIHAKKRSTPQRMD